MKTSSRRSVRHLAFLAVLGCLLTGLAAPPVQAEGLKKYTGYTRPGSPSDRVGENGKIIYAALEDGDGKNGIGGTVYFMVLELDKGKAGEKGDTWGTGIKDFDKNFRARFRPGIDSGGNSSPQLDRKAKYLYLYQTINDRKTLSPIQTSSVRLLVRPRDITSWGYFSGVGFAATQKNKLVGVSFAVQAVGDEPTEKIYQERAPHFLAPKLYSLLGIPSVNVLAEAGDKKGAKDKDPGKEPDQVILMSISDFEGVPATFQNDPRYRGMFPYFATDAFCRWMDDGSRSRRYSPAVRAIWNRENALKTTERSTIYGFTSNLPPTYAEERIRGVGVRGDGLLFAGEEGVRPAARDAALRRADGEVPTPIGGLTPAAAETGAAAFGGPVLGSTLGGQGPGIGGGGAGFPGAAVGSLGSPGIGGGFPGGAGAVGGGSGNGTPAAATTGTTTGTQQQQQQQLPNITLTQNNNQQQSQQQQQQQKQKQRQHQHQHQHQHNHNHHGHVVPAPSSLVLTLIGLPFMLLLLARRKTAVSGMAA